jgi:hypothetical protein
VVRNGKTFAKGLLASTAVFANDLSINVDGAVEQSNVFLAFGMNTFVVTVRVVQFDADDDDDDKKLVLSTLFRANNDNRCE